MGTLGKEERLWADWYDGGQRRVEGHFVEGKEDGHWIFWLGMARSQVKAIL